MEDFLDHLPFLNTLVVSKKRRVGRLQKLVKIERIQIEQVDHAHRVGLGLREQRAQQASSGNHMVVVCLFFEVFEGVERLRAFLDLIKNDEGLPGQYLFPGDQGKQFNDPLGIFVRLKNGFQFIFLIKVEIDKVFIACLPELLHEPGLAYLASAANDQRLALGIIFPFYKFRNCIAFHVPHRLILDYNQCNTFF